MYVADLRYFLGTLCSPLRFNGIPALKTFSALDATVRFYLMSRNNGSWLGSTWVFWYSWRRAWYCSVVFEGFQFASVCKLRSLDQTTRRCSSLSQSGDKYLGKDEVQWGPIVSDNKSESWSNSKGTQLRGIGRSGWYVVVLQEIEPKVRFLILWGFYTCMRTALKLLLNLVSYIKP